MKPGDRVIYMFNGEHVRGTLVREHRPTVWRVRLDSKPDLLFMCFEKYLRIDESSEHG